MFALDAANAIREFDVTQDNWTGLFYRMKGLYDFRASLGQVDKATDKLSGNLKLIHILDKIIYDDMKVVKDGKEESKPGVVFTEGSKWTAPRVTFLSMMELKDGFSTGQSEHD